MPKKTKEASLIPSDRLLMLMGFIGQDLLLATKAKARARMQAETIEITGKLLGGRFRLIVKFDAEVAH